MIKIEISNVKSRIQIKLIAFIKYTYFHISMQNLGIEFKRTRTTIYNWIEFVKKGEKIKYELNVYDAIFENENSIKILEKNGIYIIEVYRYIKIRQDVLHDLKLNLVNGTDIVDVMMMTQLKKSRLYEIKQKEKHNKESQFNKINENTIIALINKILRYCTDKRQDNKNKSYQCIIKELDKVGFSENAIYHILSRLDYEALNKKNIKINLGEAIILFIYYRLNFIERNNLGKLISLHNRKYLDSFIKQKLEISIEKLQNRSLVTKEDKGIYDALIVESKDDNSNIFELVKSDIFAKASKSIKEILDLSNIKYKFGNKDNKMTLGHLLTLVKDKKINILQLCLEYINNIVSPKDYIPIYNSKLLKSKQEHIPKSFIHKYSTDKKYNIYYSNKYNQFVYKDFYDLDFHLKSRKYETVSEEQFPDYFKKKN